MARFTDNWLSTLYTKSDIVDVVGEYTTLTERGGRHWGLCPFHNEKTPSFSVSRDKQLYYCFGCKAGGNVTNFVMNTQNISFPEAVEVLAKRAHMEMPQLMEDKQYKAIKEKRIKISEMNKIAAHYFFDTLQSEKGKAALTYLKKRGIEEKIIKRFGIGYAPDGWSNITDLLKQKGFSGDQIKDSGLVSVKDNHMYDTFRDRVMFPIINTFGDVIGFGGRVLGDGEPKYLNTRETAAFNKRRNLYGLDLVRKMRGVKSVVLVEGYMDVVSLCAHGVEAAVASLGTALTREQAVLIKRYVQDVFIAYDGDEAGKIATMKALGVLTAEGLNVRVVRVPGGMDPDDYIREHGIAGFAKIVKQAYTDIGYRLAVKKESFDMKTQDGREAYAIAASQVLLQIKSPIRRERYIEHVAGETGFSEKSIAAQMGRQQKAKSGNEPTRRFEAARPDDGAVSAFLAVAMHSPQCIADLAADIDKDLFESGAHQNIFSALIDSINRGIQPTYAELVSELEAEADRSEAARLAEMPIKTDDPAGYLRDCLAQMRTHKLVRLQDEYKKKLRSASGDERRKLLAKISELDRELADKRM